MVVVMALLLAAGCTPSVPLPPPTLRTDFRLGMITNAQGTIRDGTFNEAAYNGLRLAAREFGLDFAYHESIEDKDYQPAIETMVADGRNVIVTIGFQMIDATVQAARKHPNVFFFCVDGAPSTDAPANFVGLLFREDQGGFLAGALAGMMTTSNVVGVVAGVKIPPVERFAQGFTNGAQYVNPAVTALVEYTSSFASPDEGRSTARDMIDQEADVIFGAGGLTGASAIAYAAENRVYVIGVDLDEFTTTFASGKDAEYILTSAIKRVDRSVYEAVKSVLDGKAQGGMTVLGADRCGITYAPFHKADAAIPAAVKARLEAIWRALAGGTLKTGAGDDAGTTVEPLAAGAVPPVSDSAPHPDTCQ
jgi:basic membrane lipoprotein Med (substrate-binding protein (PBP1-ABC) superfamily)